jgi:predicted ATPase
MVSRKSGAPVTTLTIDPGQAHAGWPYTLPVIRQIASEGLQLNLGATVLLGQNGSGKSTLLEGVAAAWGQRMVAVRDDWLQHAMSLPSAEDSDLHRSLRLACTRGGPTGGLFLRAERLHGQAAGFSNRGRWSTRVSGPVLQRSHGEGFLEVLNGMTAEPGFYILDEPESALSFDSSLALLAILTDLMNAGSQILLATHSPVLAALPGATLLQLDDEGCTEVAFDDADIVVAWRSFLEAPGRYLRHLSG